MTDRQTAIEAIKTHVAVTKSRAYDSEFYMRHVTTINQLVHSLMQMGDLCLAEKTCDTLTATVKRVEECFREARSACDRIDKDVLGRLRPAEAVRSARIRASKARRMEEATRAALKEELVQLNERRGALSLATAAAAADTSAEGPSMRA